MEETIFDAGGDVTKLSSDQKHWLGKRIADNVETASDLARKYKLNRRSLTRYAEKVRKRVKISCSSGRTKLLDFISFRDLRLELAKHRHLGDDELKSKLTEYINYQRAQTMDRSIEQGVDVALGQGGKVRRVSRRTVGRYLKVLLSE